MSSERPLKVLVYSDDRTTRESVRLALGKRPAADLPELEYFECATEPAVIKAMDEGGIDLAILDGEAVPAGGLGIARQLKDEIFQCPPVLVIIGRPQDAWLATWSRAEARRLAPDRPGPAGRGRPRTCSAQRVAKLPATTDLTTMSPIDGAPLHLAAGAQPAAAARGSRRVRHRVGDGADPVRRGLARRSWPDS